MGGTDTLPQADIPPAGQVRLHHPGGCFRLLFQRTAARPLLDSTGSSAITFCKWLLMVNLLGWSLGQQMCRWGSNQEECLKILQFWPDPIFLFNIIFLSHIQACFFTVYVRKFYSLRRPEKSLTFFQRFMCSACWALPAVSILQLIVEFFYMFSLQKLKRVGIIVSLKFY